jgi:hypothetical protein
MYKYPGSALSIVNYDKRCMKENREEERDAIKFISSPPGGVAREPYTKHIDQESRGAGGMSLHNAGGAHTAKRL